jgi:hypothetical protein
LPWLAGPSRRCGSLRVEAVTCSVAQLKALAKAAPAAVDMSLLDLLPLAGNILPGLPPRLKARLF